MEFQHPPIDLRAVAGLDAIVKARFEQSTALPENFFAREAAEIARASWMMAQRFHRGGRLIAFGNGASATDAQHVAVEFVHPVIVGKRALPALALTNDTAFLSSWGSDDHDDEGAPFTNQLALFARPDDIAMGFSVDGREPNILRGLERAKRLGVLTIGLFGNKGGQIADSPPDFAFVVPSQDAMLVQEIHETLYHVLWETVHIYFEHEGLLT